MKGLPTSYLPFLPIAIYKDLFDTLLGGHLSLNSLIYDHILTQIVYFRILVIWDANSRNWIFLDVFEQKSEENGKVIKVLSE